MTEIYQFIVALLPSVIVGVIMAIFNRKMSKRFTEEDNQLKSRAKGEHAKLSLLLAESKLSYATAMAIKRGHANGEIEDAIDTYKAAMSEFHEYENSLVVDQHIKK